MPTDMQKLAVMGEVNIGGSSKVFSALTGSDVMEISQIYRGGLVYKVPVKDNSDFISKFDKDSFGTIVARPTKTIIVEQDPAPGDFVPAGTPINLKLTVKDVIPSGSFKGIDKVVVDKFADIGSLLTDLENTDDPLAKDAKSVIDKKVDYASLSTNDKTAVDNYVANRFSADTEEKKAKVYNDMKFLVHL